MNSNVLVADYASLMEYRLNRESYMTNLISKADIIVNPSYGSVVNKLIVINLPVEVPLEQLMRFNRIISRFPIGYGIEVEPLPIPEKRKTVELEDYSNLILNKHMLLDIDYAQAVDKGNFLIGTDSIIDGNITLVGYLLLRTTLENLQ